MTKGVHALVAIGVGFVVFLFGAQLMNGGAAVLAGLVAGGVTWVLTKSRRQDT